MRNIRHSIIRILLLLLLHCISTYQCTPEGNTNRTLYFLSYHRQFNTTEDTTITTLLYEDDHHHHQTLIIKLVRPQYIAINDDRILNFSNDSHFDAIDVVIRPKAPFLDFDDPHEHQHGRQLLWNKWDHSTANHIKLGRYIGDPSKVRSFYDARSLCREYYGDIASITTPEENKQVQDLCKNMTREHSGYKSCWLGMTEPFYAWEDGQFASWTQWKAGKPEHSLDEKCVRISRRTGEWDDFPCNRQLYAICEKPEAYYHGNYVVVSKQTTRDKAAEFCQRKWRSTLAAIVTQADALQAHEACKKVARAPHGCWIGLHAPWNQWDNGMEVKSIPGPRDSGNLDWKNGKRPRGQNRDRECAEIDKDGYWRAIPCDYERPVLCNVPNVDTMQSEFDQSFLDQVKQKEEGSQAEQKKEEKQARGNREHKFRKEKQARGNGGHGGHGGHGARHGGDGGDDSGSETEMTLEREHILSKQSSGEDGKESTKETREIRKRKKKKSPVEESEDMKEGAAEKEKIKTHDKEQLKHEKTSTPHTKLIDVAQHIHPSDPIEEQIESLKQVLRLQQQRLEQEKTKFSMKQIEHQKEFKEQKQQQQQHQLDEKLAETQHPEKEKEKEVDQVVDVQPLRQQPQQQQPQQQQRPSPFGGAFGGSLTAPVANPFDYHHPNGNNPLQQMMAMLHGMDGGGGVHPNTNPHPGKNVPPPPLGYNQYVSMVRTNPLGLPRYPGLVGQYAQRRRRLMQDDDEYEYVAVRKCTYNAADYAVCMQYDVASAVMTVDVAVFDGYSSADAHETKTMGVADSEPHPRTSTMYGLSYRFDFMFDEYESDKQEKCKYFTPDNKNKVCVVQSGQACIVYYNVDGEDETKLDYTYDEQWDEVYVGEVNKKCVALATNALCLTRHSAYHYELDMKFTIKTLQEN